MSSANAKKWVLGVAADDRTSDVAVRSLQERLGAVLFHLPRAAKHAGADIEHVHQLRVWTRRASAALRLYRQLIPDRRFRRMRKQLKRVRRAASDTRDCDVLILRLGRKRDRASKLWLESLRSERQRAQKEIIAAHKRLDRDRRFRRNIDKLTHSVEMRGQDRLDKDLAKFGAWARYHLRRIAADFFAAVPRRTKSDASLHQFRIRAKEFRYAVELLAGVFPDRLRKRMYPVIESIQDRLGSINDLATARIRLEEKIAATLDENEAALWRRHLDSDQKQLEKQRTQFARWLSSRALRQLSAELDEMLSCSNPRCGP